MKEIVTRDIKTSVETRETTSPSGDKELHLTGCIPYDKESSLIGGSFREVIRKGAFTKTISESNIRALWGHDTMKCLGTTANRTLTLDDRDDGLYFDILLNDKCSFARDLYELCSRGDVNSCSFGFSCIKDAWTDNGPQKPALRELLEVRLFEISPVTFPAYESNSVNASQRELFTRNGIDLDILASVLAKESRSEQDYQTIKGVVDSLKKILPEEEEEMRQDEPEESTHTAAVPTDTAESRQRDLELLENL